MIDVSQQMPSGQPYKFRMGMSKGDLSFFSVKDEEAVYEKRNMLMDLFVSDEATNPFQYVHFGATDDCKPAIIETIKTLQPNREFQSDLEKLTVANLLWMMSEPLDMDIVLLDPQLRIVGEAVFFPSRWSPTQKFGKKMRDVHSPVPKLNEALGDTIDLYLQKMPNDSSTLFLRNNIGFSQVDERNQHPIKPIPSITDMKTSYVRIEEQGLMKLRETQYIVFGIRIIHIPFFEFISHETNDIKMKTMIETMPKEMIEYKGLNSELAKEIIRLCNI